MNFMDAKTVFYLQNWKEAVDSSDKVHRFRTHTQKELRSFERMLNKRNSVEKPRTIV
jgi:hypothetical protein